MRERERRRMMLERERGAEEMNGPRKTNHSRPSLKLSTRTHSSDPPAILSGYDTQHAPNTGEKQAKPERIAIGSARF